MTPGLERYYQFDDGFVDVMGNSLEVDLPSHIQLVDSTAPTNSLGNTSPVAVDDDSTTSGNQSVTIDVLANDSDADGDFLLILEAIATNGSVIINSARTLTYTPDVDYSGEDWISYRISNGNGKSNHNPDLVILSEDKALALNGTNGIDI